MDSSRLPMYTAPAEARWSMHLPKVTTAHSLLPLATSNLSNVHPNSFVPVAPQRFFGHPLPAVGSTESALGRKLNGDTSCNNPRNWEYAATGRGRGWSAARLPVEAKASSTAAEGSWALDSTHSTVPKPTPPPRAAPRWHASNAIMLI